MESFLYCLSSSRWRLVSVVSELQDISARRNIKVYQSGHKRDPFGEKLSSGNPEVAFGSLTIRQSFAFCIRWLIPDKPNDTTWTSLYYCYCFAFEILSKKLVKLMGERNYTIALDNDRGHIKDRYLLSPNNFARFFNVIGILLHGRRGHMIYLLSFFINGGQKSLENVSTKFSK